MKQIQFSSFGPPSQVAKCVDVADVGAPSAWEVIVDIEAFPINVADLAMLAGRYGTLPQLPSSIGMEAVGRVSVCGASVKNIHVGDRVVVLANHNWSQRRKVAAAAVHKVPESADVKQMAMLKVNPATAYLLLTRCSAPVEGDWIIQNAPLSSVGRCVIQIAKQMRLHTINIVRRAESIPDVLSLGGDIAIEDGPDVAERIRAIARHEPAKFAFDAVAGAATQRLAECLSEGGQIVTYGMLSGEHAVLSPEQIIFRGITLSGFWLSKTLNRMSHPERTSLFDTLAEMVTAGKLMIDIDSHFSIDAIGPAIQRAEQNQRKGKVLVFPNHTILEA